MKRLLTLSVESISVSDANVEDEKVAGEAAVEEVSEVAAAEVVSEVAAEDVVARIKSSSSSSTARAGKRREPRIKDKERIPSRQGGLRKLFC